MGDDLDFVWRVVPSPRPAPPPAGAEVVTPRQEATPSPEEPQPRPEEAERGEADDRLVPLRTAAEAAGVAVSTVRNWARKGRIPSRMVDEGRGPRRLVDMEAVLARARKLDRASPGPAAEETAPAVPEGHMLVPLDAWEKMLVQLGNLHQAGQQLAEARERAAKAETEAVFLRERLAELRAAKVPAPERAAPEPETGPASDERPWWKRAAAGMRKAAGRLRR